MSKPAAAGKVTDSALSVNFNVWGPNGPQTWNTEALPSSLEGHKKTVEREPWGLRSKDSWRRNPHPTVKTFRKEPTKIQNPGVSSQSSTSLVEYRNKFGDKEVKCSTIRRGPVPKAWLTGKIVTSLETKKILFVKPGDPGLPEGYGPGDVMIPHERFPDYVLKMQTSDLVTFKLGFKRKDKPMGLKAHVIQYSNRKIAEIVAYLEMLSKNLESKRRQVLVQVLSPTHAALWYFLCNIDDECEDLNRKILVVMTTIIQNCHDNEQSNLAKETISIFMKGKLFQSFMRLSDFSNFTDEVIPFCKQLAGFMPNYFHKMMPLIETLINDSREHPKVNLLFEFVKAFSKVGAAEDCLFRSILPSSKELIGQLMERSADLNPVNDKKSYSSYSEYTEVYFNLLRAECFASIQRGILDLRKEKLDDRDMNCFKSIRLAGIQMSGKRPSFGISFTPVKPVRDWKRSTQLMYGNLVCLSPRQDFSDLIWGVVSDRSDDLLNKQPPIISIEFIESNNLAIHEIAIALVENDGYTLMVESPTYFETFKNVLLTMKSLDFSKYELASNIVFGNYEGADQVPQYLRDALKNGLLKAALNDGNYSSSSAFNDADDQSASLIKINKMINPQENSTTSLEEISIDKDYTPSLDSLIEDYISENCKKLETSQKQAFYHCLKNKLAIVQGPPGTGKTLVGFELLKFILSVGIEGPILVLTYKNHALDEFLMMILKSRVHVCGMDEMVRLGNQSKEPRLAEIMIRNHLERRPIFTELNEMLEAYADQAEKLLNDFLSTAIVDVNCFLNVLTEKQFCSFLLGYNWRRFRIQSLVVTYGYLQLLIKRNVYKDENGNYIDIVKSVFIVLFKKWCPNIDNLKKLRELQKSTSLFTDTEFDGDNKSETDVDNVDEVGEDMVRNLQSARQSYKSDFGRNLQMRLLNLKMYSGGYTLSHFPSSCVANNNILNTENVWSLTETERAHFIITILLNKKEEFSNAFQDLESTSKEVMDIKTLQMNNAKVEVLQKMKVIGATITGASINHNLIKAVSPKVVIVEEAAEVLEPSLIAALSPNVQHLILIGDHKQLRPSVDTYRLRCEYKFDISMMERLININYPYKTLQKQGRMRTEFAELLKDIYPEYDNLSDLNESRKPFPMLEKSMFFWSHNFLETKFRSVENKGEADMVLYLAFFMIVNGVNPSEITILASYKGQQKVLRDKFREMKKCDKYESYFKDPLFDKSHSNDLDIQTIDMYQGDENDFIIISLVRSNNLEDPNIGFLRSNNRRCVAQSRARRGMYFVGNVEMFRHHWKFLVNGMEKSECVGESITVVCDKHPCQSKLSVKNSDELRNVIYNPHNLCSEQCIYEFRCGHACTQKCKCPHNHVNCYTKVNKLLSYCQHVAEEYCYIHEATIICNEMVEHTFSCGHKDTVICNDKKMKNISCKEQIEYTFPACKHKDMIECKNKMWARCKFPCDKRMESCFVHMCPEKCGDPHGHSACLQMVNYVFPLCGHNGPEQKRCSKKITWVCEETVSVDADCGHTVDLACHLRQKGQISCEFPCKKNLKCGHLCTKKCFEPCTTNCKLCKKERKLKAKEANKMAKKAIEAELKKLKAQKVGLLELIELSREEDPAEFQSIEDCVLKYIQPCHNWYPKITKIEKVYNKNLMTKYLQMKLKMKKMHEDRKFHGTSNEGIAGVTKKGFRLPINSGMYGKGIYLATDSSKSAQNVYTKNSNKLLLCKVLLGRSFIFKTKDEREEFLKEEREYEGIDSYGAKFLNKKKFDSIYAPRGSEVQNDEFIIFNPNQVYPEFIISYTLGSLSPLPALATMNKTGFQKHRYEFNRRTDRNNPLFAEASIALAHYNRTVRAGPARSNFIFNTDKVDIIQNPTLENHFYVKKAEFDRLGRGDEILAFHATGKLNVDSILKNNLDPNRAAANGRAYGNGCYFSEFPDFSANYGDSLIIFRVLPGREYEGPECLPQLGYHSKKVRADEKGYGEQIIIQNNHQFLPAYVFYKS